MIYLYEQICHIHFSRYSTLAGERRHLDPATMSLGEPRSSISGGGRRGPFSTQEREKALEAVRAVTQPKVCITEVQTAW